jgi:hypothetical protein
MRKIKLISVVKIKTYLTFSYFLISGNIFIFFTVTGFLLLLFFGTGTPYVAQAALELAR